MLRLAWSRYEYARQVTLYHVTVRPRDVIVSSAILERCAVWEVVIFIGKPHIGDTIWQLLYTVFGEQRVDSRDGGVVNRTRIEQYMEINKCIRPTYVLVHGQVGRH